MKNRRFSVITLILITFLICVMVSVPAFASKGRIRKIRFRESSGTYLLGKGKTHKLRVKLTPSSASRSKLVWKSSRPKVVRVSQKGVIRGRRTGTAVITVRSRSNKKVKAKIKVRVVRQTTSVTVSLKKETVHAASVSGGVFMQLGSSAALKAKLSSSASIRKVTWRSSNPKVISVSSSGKIEAKKTGSAVIRATAADGSGKYGQIAVTSAQITHSDCTVIAHRGYSAAAPGNSMAAFRKAMKESFDGLELDLRVTADGQFIVSHDSNLLYYCGRDVNVKDLTLSELKSMILIRGRHIDDYPYEHLPSLGQVLSLARKYPKKTLMLELKGRFPDASLEKLLTTLQGAGMMNRVILISFAKGNLQAIRGMTELGGDNVPLGYVRQAPTDDDVDLCISLQASLCGAHYNLTKEQVVRMHASGLTVNTWIVPTFRKAWVMIHEYGVDSITTNYDFQGRSS